MMSAAWRSAIVLVLVVGVVAWTRTSDMSRSDIVARVNGEPVTRAETLAMQADPFARPDVDRVGFALRKTIIRRLVLQEAARREVRIQDEDVDRAIVALPRTFADGGSLLAWLRARGLDERSLRETIRTELTIARVIAGVVSDAAAAEAHTLEGAEAEKTDVERGTLIANGEKAFQAWVTEQKRRSRIEMFR
jgi:SurA-like protein